MNRVKLEEKENRRRLHIGSMFVDLNEVDYRELIKIFSASTPHTEDIKDDFRSIISHAFLGCDTSGISKETWELMLDECVKYVEKLKQEKEMLAAQSIGWREKYLALKAAHKAVPENKSSEEVVPAEPLYTELFLGETGNTMTVNCFDDDHELSIVIRDNGRKAIYSMNAWEVKQAIDFLDAHLKNENCEEGLKKANLSQVVPVECYVPSQEETEFELTQLVLVEGIIREKRIFVKKTTTPPNTPQ